MKTIGDSTVNHNYYGTDIEQTTDGGYIILGGKDWNTYLVKTNNLGELNFADPACWTKTYTVDPKRYYYEGTSVKKDPAGSGYVLCGNVSEEYPHDGDYWDIYITNTDANGDPIKDVNGNLKESIYGKPGSFDWAGKMVIADDGKYVVGGYTDGYGSGGWEALMMKIDPASGVATAYTYGSGIDEWANSICQTPDGGFIMVGGRQNPGSDNVDILLIKTDRDGNRTWAKTYRSQKYSEGYSVQLTKESNGSVGYIITGIISSTVNTSGYGGNADVILLKTTGTGDLVFAKAYGGNGDDAGLSVQQINNFFIVAGYTKSFGQPVSDGFVLKINNISGAIIWTKAFGSTTAPFGGVTDYLSGFVPTSSGFTFTGQVDDHGAGHQYSEAFLVNTSLAGDSRNTVCQTANLNNCKVKGLRKGIDIFVNDVTAQVVGMGPFPVPKDSYTPTITSNEGNSKNIICP